MESRVRWRIGLRSTGGPHGRQCASGLEGFNGLVGPMGLDPLMGPINVSVSVSLMGFDGPWVLWA